MEIRVLFPARFNRAIRVIRAIRVLFSARFNRAIRVIRAIRVQTSLTVNKIKYLMHRLWREIVQI